MTRHINRGQAREKETAAKRIASALAVVTAPALPAAAGAPAASAARILPSAPVTVTAPRQAAQQAGNDLAVDLGASTGPFQGGAAGRLSASTARTCRATT